MAGVTVTDTDLGMDQIIANLTDTSFDFVDVGLFGTQGSDLVKYAAANHFGVPEKSIPSRPFITQAVDRNESKYQKITFKLGRRIVDGDISKARAFQLFGAIAEADIKREIRIGGFKKNADSTVDRKTKGKGGKTTPLIDTGRMRQSITFALGKNGAE